MCPDNLRVLESVQTIFIELKAGTARLVEPGEITLLHLKCIRTVTFIHLKAFHFHQPFFVHRSFI